MGIESVDLSGVAHGGKRGCYHGEFDTLSPDDDYAGLQEFVYEAADPRGAGRAADPCVPRRPDSHGLDVRRRDDHAEDGAEPHARLWPALQHRRTGADLHPSAVARRTDGGVLP